MFNDIYLIINIGFHTHTNDILDTVIPNSLWNAYLGLMASLNYLSYRSGKPLKRTLFWERVKFVFYNKIHILRISFLIRKRRRQAF